MKLLVGETGRCTVKLSAMAARLGSYKIKTSVISPDTESLAVAGMGGIVNILSSGEFGAVTDAQTTVLIDADMRELSDMIPHMMWVSGPHGGVLFFNARFCEYTGIPCDQGYGIGWLDVIHPDDLKECVRTRAEALRVSQTWYFEYRLRRHDGEYRWHVGRAVPLFDDAGVVRRWVGTATDIQLEKEAAQKQRRFMREVLASVTDGRLLLCDSADDLPAPLSDAPVGGSPVTLSRESLGAFRHLVSDACAEVGLSQERASDLTIAVGEAAMNAVIHGGESSKGYVYAIRDGGGCVQVWVADGGNGIAEESLHRATLERGFSSTGTLGYGFPLMLGTADRVYLLTGASGTSVVLEQAHMATG